MRSTRPFSGFLLVLLLSSSCVTSPTTGSTPESQVATITFEGYAPWPGAHVEVQALNYRTKVYDVIATTTASQRAIYLPPSVELYPWSVTGSVAVLGDSASACHWSDTCGVLPNSVHRPATIRVRAFGPGNHSQDLFSFDAHTGSCMFANGLYDNVAFAYAKCAPKDWDHIYLNP